MHLLYSMALALALVVSAPWWLVQMLRHGKYRAGLGERFGRVPRRLHREGGHTSWVHAVSVGEVLAISGVVQELRRRLPDRRMVVSTTTATGQKLAREKFGEANVFYFPLDFAFAIRPYLRALRPELVVVAETEFWPNFLREVRQSGARVAIVNARISDRSYPRYRLLRGLVRRALSGMDIFLAQSDEDARRLREIGAPAERVHVSGNLKFDVKPPATAPIVSKVRAAVAESGAWPIVVAGSTVDGEEAIVLEAFRQFQRSFPGALLVLAPRHPERFAAVADLLHASGTTFRRRSQWNDEPLGAGVFLLDTIGELGALYAVADMAFVGGSLVPRGGHNILEPALHGVPVIAGPYTENFRDIVSLFRSAGALPVVKDAAELAAVLTDLANKRDVRELLAAQGKAIVQQHAGATARTAAALAELLAAADKSEEPARR
ncbi:MAG: 3-deoxy-D-manno-octulosonic acid transferase [Terriglobales bacterium]